MRKTLKKIKAKCYANIYWKFFENDYVTNLRKKMEMNKLVTESLEPLNSISIGGNLLFYFSFAGINEDYKLLSGLG